MVNPTLRYTYKDPGPPICDDVFCGTGGNIDSGSLPENDIYFFHPDHLGSTSYITNIAGETVQFNTYMPFGESFVSQQRTTSVSAFLFNGKERDVETGLYYYGARYYNSKTSVWLSVDPIALYDPIDEVEHYLDGQHNGGYFNPRNTSVYGYCYQNPIAYVDPNGKQSKVTNEKSPETNFTKPPFGYRQSQNKNFETKSYENVMGVVKDFIIGNASENTVVIGGALEEVKSSTHVALMKIKLVQEAFKDGEFKKNEMVGDSFNMGEIGENKESLHILADPFSADNLLGGFEMTARLHDDGETVTMSVYDSKTLGSATDCLINRDHSDSDRGPLKPTNQRYIWQTTKKQLLIDAYKATKINE